MAPLMRQGRTVVAVTSGANMNFGRLRLVADLAGVGARQEAILVSTIPERPGVLPGLHGRCARRHRHRDHRVQVQVGVPALTRSRDFCHLPNVPTWMWERSHNDFHDASLHLEGRTWIFLVATFLVGVAEGINKRYRWGAEQQVQVVCPTQRLGRIVLMTDKIKAGDDLCVGRYSAEANAHILWGAGVRSAAEAEQLTQRLNDKNLRTRDVSNIEAAQV